MDQADQSPLNEEKTMPLPQQQLAAHAISDDEQEPTLQEDAEMVAHPQQAGEQEMSLLSASMSLGDEDTMIWPPQSDVSEEHMQRSMQLPHRTDDIIMLPHSRRQPQVMREPVVQPPRVREPEGEGGMQAAPVSTSMQLVRRGRPGQAPSTHGSRGPAWLIVTFIAGLLIGCSATVVGILLLGSVARPLVVAVSPTSGSITAQVSPTYIAAVAQKNLAASGLPGTVSQVQVSLAHNGPITLTGNDQFLLITNPFTIVLQPYIQACQVKVHVLHADLGLVNVTGFAATFESQINQQLQLKLSDLPSGFTYCAVGVHTEPQGVDEVLSATAQK